MCKGKPDRNNCMNSVRNYVDEFSEESLQKFAEEPQYEFLKKKHYKNHSTNYSKDTITIHRKISQRNPKEIPMKFFE